jgi:chromosome segregation ATPase
MENKELPEEIKEQIENGAKSYAEIKYEETWHKKGLHRKTLLMYAHEDGATEWAQWKVRYDELARENSILKQHDIQLRLRLSVCEKEVEDYKTEHQQLKERCDKMEAEHADLNLALAAMLNGYQNLSMSQKDWFTVPKDLIDAYTKMVLEYDTPEIEQGKEEEKEVKP